LARRRRKTGWRFLLSERLGANRSRATAPWLVPGLIPAAVLPNAQPAVDGDGDEREEHGEVEAGFVKEGGDTEAGELGERKGSDGVAEEDRELGGEERGEDDGDQEQCGVAGNQVEGDGKTGGDFDSADEGAEQLRIWEADSCETTGAKVIRVEEFQGALGNEDQSHDEPDQGHGQGAFHRYLRRVADSGLCIEDTAEIEERRWDLLKRGVGD